MMANQDLVKFIKEARKRGFDDLQIKKPLLNHGWPLNEIESAFAHISPKPKIKYRNKVTLYIPNEVLELLEKRSKKNMMTLSEQIEDILRRSVINTKKTKQQEEKLDDMLVGLFSRRQYKKPKKKAKKK